MNSVNHGGSSVDTPGHGSRDLVGQLDALMSAHRRITGRKLSWREAASRLAEYGDALGCGGSAPPAWAADVLALLCAWRYEPAAIREILGHAREHDTVWDLDEVWRQDEDQEEVEDLLPGVPDVAWESFEAVTYTAIA